MTTNSTALVAVLSLSLAPLVVTAQELSLPAEHADDWTGDRETFTGAVERALAQNPQVVTAREELIRARALLEQTRAASIPTLAANGGYTRLDADRTLNAVLLAGESQLSANLTVTAPLFSPKTWAQWAHASDNVRVAAGNDADVRRQLALATGRAYLTVLTQRKLLEVTRVARDAARAFYEFALARRTGGVGNRIDEVRAAQELATDESKFVNARTQLERAREALGVIIGVERPVDAREEPDLAERKTVDAALNEVSTRADVRAAVLRRDAAHKVTRDSFSDYLPLLTGSFEPFYQNPPTTTVPKTGWQALLVLNVPLFDGGLRYGQRRERSALEREARVQLEGVLRQARSEVRVAFDSVRDADAALSAARDAARLAKEALALANTAYHSGVSTNFELIDAERQARDADEQSALAEDAAREARLDLLAASGRFPDLK